MSRLAIHALLPLLVGYVLLLYHKTNTSCALPRLSPNLTLD
jgi:hypothetical protein